VGGQVGVGAGREMTQALYTHMNNKTIKKYDPENKKMEIKQKKKTQPNKQTKKQGSLSSLGKRTVWT
jgi:hypothetical protein